MKNALVVLLLFPILIFSGCIKDTVNNPDSGASLNDNAKLLFYLEDEGDYINSNEMPSLADVDEVYSNLQIYLLLDIRPPAEFTAGHIEGAINKSHSDLITFLDSIEHTSYPKIIIISRNGQSSAFYTSLLRLYGFQNVFSMSYGMAAWNQEFSSQWLAARSQNENLLTSFNLEYVPKPDYSPLPSVTLESGSLPEAVKKRIGQVMQENYEDNLTGGSGYATVDFQNLMLNFNEYFIVCYDEGLLYRQLILHIAHPPGAVLYSPPPISSDLSSTTYLQTLPSDRKIAFYSTDGQLSAFAAAYLKVLGYNVKSILFGANNMFYDTVLGADGLNNQAFTTSKIKNYPYVTGN